MIVAAATPIMPLRYTPAIFSPMPLFSPCYALILAHYDAIILRRRRRRAARASRYYFRYYFRLRFIRHYFATCLRYVDDVATATIDDDFRCFSYFSILSLMLSLAADRLRRRHCRLRFIDIRRHTPDMI